LGSLDDLATAAAPAASICAAILSASAGGSAEVFTDAFAATRLMLAKLAA